MKHLIHSIGSRLARNNFVITSLGKAKCRTCQKVLQNTRASIQKHLKCKHKELYQDWSIHKENLKKTKQSNIEEHSALLPSGELVQTSNFMGHQVTTVCQICHEDFALSEIPKHTRMKHNLHILEYKEQFGSTYGHIRTIDVLFVQNLFFLIHTSYETM